MSTVYFESAPNESAKRFVGLGKMFADSFVILAMSVGSKTGLIDKLLSYDQPKTCTEIADDAGLKERSTMKLYIFQ